MANKGIEPRLEGYTDDEGFKWVEDGLQKCLATAEKCGVVLGLENHWGLGRTAAGVLRVINAVKSPWLRATLDTGNFLENQYEQYAELAPEAVFVQAKTYFGGGTWYTLDIDYDPRGKNTPRGGLPRVHFIGIRRQREARDCYSKKSRDASQSIFLTKTSTAGPHFSADQRSRFEYGSCQKLRDRCCEAVLLVTFGNFEQMVAELGFNRSLHDANFTTKHRLVEFGNHLPR